VRISRSPLSLWRLPPRAQSRPAGALIGLGMVALLTLLLLLIDRRLAHIPNPSLPYTVLILALAYGWGGRIGFSTAVASLFVVWYVLVPSQVGPASDANDVTRVILISFTYGAMVLVGDAFRRLRRANARLAGTVERLNTVFASIADGVLVLDRQGELLQTNDGMRRILAGEVPHSLALRAASWHTRHPDGTPLATGSGPTTAAFQGTITTGYDLVIRNAGGQDVPLSVSSAPVRQRGGAIVGAVIVCRDVTEMRRLQQTKDDFLSIASHELKTPLTAMLGYTQLLRQRMQRLELVDERLMGYLGTLDSQSRRMAELVDTLLDVSRLDSGRIALRRESFDLAQLVRETTGQLGELSPQHPIDVITAPAVVLGIWDRDRIDQIVTNLLTNAVRYSPKGGAISVVVGIRPGTPTAGDMAREEAFVRVRDVGLGLPADQRERIFERFHRAHEGEMNEQAEAQRGMGLGLFISRALAERHGGQLRAESDGPGRGATFTLSLPLQHAMSVAPQVQPQAQSSVG